jgi:hypothetical protein
MQPPNTWKRTLLDRGGTGPPQASDGLTQGTGRGDGANMITGGAGVAVVGPSRRMPSTGDGADTSDALVVGVTRGPWGRLAPNGEFYPPTNDTAEYRNVGPLA